MSADLLRAFVRYAAVGALATLVHFGVLTLCVEVWHWPAWWGSGAGAVVGAQVAFVGNRMVTFEHRGAVAPAWVRFMGTALLGAMVSMAIVAAAVALGSHYLLAQGLATAWVLLLTFIVNRHWTFRPSP